MLSSSEDECADVVNLDGKCSRTFDLESDG